MRQSLIMVIRSVLDVVGLILLVGAGWIVHPALGLTVAGVGCILLAWMISSGDRGEGGR